MEEINKIENKEVNLNNIDTNANSEAPSSPITATKKRGAKKGQLSEKTKESLAKGREKLNQKWEEDRKRKEELTIKYAQKKAEKLEKEKKQIKKQMGLKEESEEEQEQEIYVAKKKTIQPKKKKIVIVEESEESEKEEQVVVKKKTIPEKAPAQKEPIKEQPTHNNNLRLVFF